MPPVLDSLDNYKILSERMNVLTIYLPWGKLPVASNLRIVKTAVWPAGPSGLFSPPPKSRGQSPRFWTLWIIIPDYKILDVLVWYVCKNCNI